jgi:hypothetical protein
VCGVQEGGKALVNLLFGSQSPSGRLPITWYSNSYTAAVSPLNLNMRPDLKAEHPGRSYRWVKTTDKIGCLYCHWQTVTPVDGGKEFLWVRG